MKILIVDDSATQRMAIRTILHQKLKINFDDMVMATDGQDGIEKIIMQKYDLVITDVEMPRMNGLEMLSALRLNPNYESTPAIILSSMADPYGAELQAKYGKALWLNKGGSDFYVQALPEAVCRFGKVGFAQGNEKWLC